MKNLPIPHVDSDAICALVFYANRSSYYYRVKEVAGFFKSNSVIKVGTRNVHVVVVQKEPRESIFAARLIDIIGEWRGPKLFRTKIFGPGGVLLNAWRLREILSCYGLSFHAANSATCRTAASLKPQFPCRQAAFPPRWINGEGPLEEYLDWVTEVHAAFCPRFAIESAKNPLILQHKNQI